MTLEEANKYADEMDKLTDEREEFIKKLMRVRCSDKHREFIEWLLTEQDLCDTCGYEEGSIYCKKHCPYEAKVEQESSGDAISRQAAIDALTKTSGIRGDALKALYELPPVNLTKTGHWIEKDGFDGDTYYDCSECGESWTTIYGTAWDNGMKYCPNCGCRMVEPQEESGE